MACICICSYRLELGSSLWTCVFKLLKAWSIWPARDSYIETSLQETACKFSIGRVTSYSLIYSGSRIDSGFVVKVADFGLSESIEISKDYFRQTKEEGIKLPVKWLAPECINDGIFSEKTDVVRIYG